MKRTKEGPLLLLWEKLKLGGRGLAGFAIGFGILFHRDDSGYSFSVDIATRLFGALFPSSQSATLTPVYCCSRCHPLLDPNGKFDFSTFNDPYSNCQFCALIRTLTSHLGNLSPTRQLVNKNYVHRLHSSQVLYICAKEGLSRYSKPFRLWRFRRSKPSTASTYEMASRAPSSVQYHLLREWLRYCDETHHCNKRTGETEGFLPTRLLFVGNRNDPDLLRLTLSADLAEAKYVVLSHRWGTQSEDDKTRYCTTMENIGHRQHGFNIADLPKTFQDAIRVTRELGVEYIWIDSLCIIQHGDAQRDWDKESILMESVYSSAYCTIAATSARDMKDGFLDRNTGPKFLYVQNTSGQQFYVCAGTDDFETDVNKAELNTRAWVLQERLLSRRIIHFSASQIYWECGEGVCCGNLIHMHGKRRGFFFMHDSHFPNRLFKQGFYTTLEFVQTLFQNYSSFHLTENTDRAVAISGLQHRIAHTLDSKYSYGIMEKYFHRNLLWHAHDRKLERISYPGQGVPSWSWMAYNGRILFMNIPFGRVEWLDNIRFEDERMLSLTASIHKFQNCTTNLVKTRHVVVDSGRVERGWIRYDVENVTDIFLTRCVIIGRYRKARLWGPNYYFVLVVKRTGVSGEYKRVGSGEIHENYVARKSIMVRVD